jgi:branched-chain amino acid transport system substrate-binding protein
VEAHYTQLARDGAVDFFLGPYSSNLVLAASPVAEQYGIPLVTGGGASSRIFSRGYRYTFGTLPSARDFFKDAIRLFAGEGGARTLALIYADDAFSTDVAAGARDWAADSGLEIVLDRAYADGQTEFADLIAALRTAAPDVVMGANHLVEAAAFVPQARAAGLEADLVLTGVTNPEFLALGEAVEGVFGVAPWIPTQTTAGPLFGSAGQYAETFAARFGYVPEYHNANGTAEVLSFKYAVEAAGTLDRDAVRDALAALRYESFYGTVAFGPDGQIDKVQTVIQIQGGAVVSVGPGGEATAVYGSR